MKKLCHFVFWTVLAGVYSYEAFGQGPVAGAPLERSFVYKGNMYFLQGKNLVVISTSDPMQVVSVFSTGETYDRIAMNNSTTSPYDGAQPTAGADYLYLVEHSGRAKILSIADPANVQEVSTIPTTTSYQVFNIMVEGDTAYATESYYSTAWKLSLWDVSNPAAPAVLGQTNLGLLYSKSIGGQIRVVDQDHIIFDVPDSIVQIQDVQNAASPEHVFTFFYSADGGMVTRDGKVYMFVIDDWQTSLFIYDLADPAEPMLLGSMPNVDGKLAYSSSITMMEKDGSRYILLGATDVYYEWMLVIDVTNAAAPRVVRRKRLQSVTGDVVPYDTDVIGNEALIYGWNMPWPGPGGEYRYRYYAIRMDVTDPLDPRIVSTVEVPSLFVKDLVNAPLGEAQVSSDAQGHLIVSPSGSSDLDGVALEVGECDGVGARLYPFTLALAGQAFNLTVQGKAAERPTHDLATVTLANEGVSLYLSADYAAVDATGLSWKVLNNDVVTGSATLAAAGGSLGLISSPDGPMPQFTGFTTGPTPAAPVFREEPLAGVSIVLEFAGPVRFAPSIGDAVLGDRIVISNDAVAAGRSKYTGFSISGRNLGPVEIMDVWRLIDPLCGDEQHPYPQADINHDCRVNLGDLAQITAQWLACTAPVCD